MGRGGNKRGKLYAPFLTAPSIPSCCHSPLIFTLPTFSSVELSLSRCNPLSIVVIIVIIPAKRRPVVERSFPPLDSRESGRNLSRARIPNGREGGREKKEKYEITVRDLISSRYLHGSARYFRPVGGWNAWPWRGGEWWWKRLRSRYLRSHRIPILSPLLIVIPGLR